jgi:hypothetical protein
MPLSCSSIPKQQRCVLHVIQLSSAELLAFRIYFFILKTRAEVFIRSVLGETIIDSVAQTGSANLGLHTSFAHAREDFASYANSILFVFYTFSGNEQPFYVRISFQSIIQTNLIMVSGAQ